LSVSFFLRLLAFLRLFRLAIRIEFCLSLW
jgi:hypothetical protein